MGGRWSWVAGLFLALSLSGAADAHMRDYLVSQPYYTASQGEFEVALWNDVNFSDADDDDSYNSKHQVEFEYGVTDHFMLAYYEVYTWNRASDWERDEAKVEAKLRFAEAGQWPVDVALYTEYKNPNGSRDVRSDELENKIILSKDFGLWNVIGNVIFERHLNEHTPWAYEYTLGVSRALNPRARAGVEVKESIGDSDEFGWHRDDRELYVVPGIYFSPQPHTRVVVGPAFGLTDASDDVQLRSIFEVEF
jgi:hypothetical protein